MLRANLAGKSRIEQLESELAAAKALADKQAEMTQMLREEHAMLTAAFDEHRIHENELESQFMIDQAEIGKAASI